MEFLDTLIFSFSNYELRLSQLLAGFLLVVISYSLFRWLRSYLNPKLDSWISIKDQDKKKLVRIIKLLFFTLSLLGLVFILGLNYRLSARSPIPLSVSIILEAFAIIQFARLLDWIVSNYLIHRNYVRRDQEKIKEDLELKDIESHATKTVQYLVYVFALILILRDFQLDRPLIEFALKDGQLFSLKITNILGAISIILIARLVIWVITQLVLYSYYKQKKIEIGARFAVNQLIAYVIYVIAFMFAFQALGINMTLIWGGAAALLVGIGLGLQQTFNDFFSGIVLLFERTVKVGDVVQMDSLVGTIRKIGLRSSIVEARDAISIVVPNSKLVNQNVINWSHNSESVRFVVGVHVAYGSDTQLVKKLLLEAAHRNESVMNFPAPFIRFKNFANSALAFELYFFSTKLITEEDVKSDLRFEIDRLFKENKVKIPFPQSEVYLHNKP